MTSLLTTEDEPTHLREGQAGPPGAANKRSSRSPYWARIDRSDEALLDFDAEALEFDIGHARALLREHPTTYRNHLAIAKFIEGWIERITNDAKPGRFNEGFIEALLEMSDHLRAGDFAVEPGDEVECNDPSLTTEITSSNGDLRAAVTRTSFETLS